MAGSGEKGAQPGAKSEEESKGSPAPTETSIPVRSSKSPATSEAPKGSPESASPSAGNASEAKPEAKSEVKPAADPALKQELAKDPKEPSAEKPSENPTSSTKNSVNSSSSTKETKTNSEHPAGIGPNDILIAVMGVTGTGKTSFIQTLTDDTLDVGSSLISCTAKVAAHRCNIPGSRRIWLIDTPGFDDTYRTDGDILAEIVHFLTVSDTQILLSGVIYLHRIQDPRISQALLRNINTFKKLCGPDGLKRTVLVTTFWDAVTEDVGQSRVNQLLDEQQFWRFIKENNGEPFRYDLKNKEQAIKIVQHVVNSGLVKTKLTIQTEIVEQKLTLGETGAGKVLTDAIEMMIRQFQAQLDELTEKLKKKDEEIAQVNKDKESVERRLAEYEREKGIYNLRKDELHKLFKPFSWIRASGRGRSGLKGIDN